MTPNVLTVTRCIKQHKTKPIKVLVQCTLCMFTVTSCYYLHHNKQYCNHICFYYFAAFLPHLLNYTIIITWQSFLIIQECSVHGT